MKDFVELSELFLKYTFVQTTADDINITKVKKYDESQEIKGSFTSLPPVL